jgi:hypothetical protein
MNGQRVEDRQALPPIAAFVRMPPREVGTEGNGLGTRCGGRWCVLWGDRWQPSVALTRQRPRRALGGPYVALWHYRQAVGPMTVARVRARLGLVT